MTSTLTTHVLYRFYGTDNELLYIGITNNPGARLTSHRKGKGWWNLVARVEIEHHFDRWSLMCAEREAIRKERPKFNVQHNGADAEELNAIERNGLVGRWFHTWRARECREVAPVKHGRAVEYWGQVTAQIGEGQYLVEISSWVDGIATKCLAGLDDMRQWTFYLNSVEMTVAVGCTARIGRGYCGKSASYVSGKVPLCRYCARRYRIVREVIWVDGVATLGPARNSRAARRRTSWLYG